MHPEKLPPSRPLTSRNRNTSLHPYFSVTGLLPCTVHSELHYMRTTTIVLEQFLISGPIFHAFGPFFYIRNTSLHPDNFPASNQPVSSVIQISVGFRWTKTLVSSVNLHVGSSGLPQGTESLSQICPRRIFHYLIVFQNTFILLSNPFKNFTFNHPNTCLDAHYKRARYSAVKDTDQKLH